MTQPSPTAEWREYKKAMDCLRLELPEPICADVEAKADAAIHAAEQAVVERCVAALWHSDPALSRVGLIEVVRRAAGSEEG